MWLFARLFWILPPSYYSLGFFCVFTEAFLIKKIGERGKERKKTDNPREGWEDGTPPPHRDFKERCVMR